MWLKIVLVGSIIINITLFMLMDIMMTQLEEIDCSKYCESLSSGEAQLNN